MSAVRVALTGGSGCGIETEEDEGREAAVWPRAVVIVAPACDSAACIEQIAEPARVQTFIAKPTVEGFNVTVLHRPAGLDVIRRDLPFNTPGKEMARGELRAVVQAQSRA